MKLRAVNDRIIIIRDGASEKTTVSGLIIPAAAQDTPQTATVIGTGDGWFQHKVVLDERGHAENVYTPIPVKVGDKILIGKYSGAEVELDGRKLTIIGPEDVLAVIEE
jgi:chaperonin GroES